MSAADPGSRFMAGVACIEFTPPAGVMMSGFVARTEPASGAHDALTARAIVIDDTAILCADVLGLDTQTCAAIRERCSLPSSNVIVAALHTHGGPHALPGRFMSGFDPAVLDTIADACVEAVDKAAASREAATIRFGAGGDPGIGKNRRHAGGTTDTMLPVMEIAADAGRTLATLVSYACHPVVLGADNRLWTADYPFFVRDTLETARDAAALFLTGCCGDVNTGHSAHASLTLDANAERSYEAAERIGKTVAARALDAELATTSGPAAKASRDVALGFERLETQPLETLAAQWRTEAAEADPVRSALLGVWAAWAERGEPDDLAAIRRTCRVSALRWGAVEIIALPGEIFAETALTIRERIGNPHAFVVCFADDNPGYIPPASEFIHGGYEVEEAHRYYAMPATFAKGSAEKLADAAVECVLQLRQQGT